MSLLGRVAARLHDEHIQFAIIGATALAAHGVSRSTLDIDLLTISPRVLEPEFWSLDDVVADVRRGGHDDPLAGVVRLTATGERPIDVVVGRFRWQAVVIDTATSTPVDDILMPIANPAGLVLLKLYAGSPQDAWDIAQLLETPHREDLIASVEDRIDQLPADAGQLWNRIRHAR